MKRFTLIVALMLMVAVPMLAERVTPETARKVATTFLNNNGAKTAQLTDLTKAAGFPNLYIFTAEQGFVVMAADDRVKPILGYSLTNTFVAEGMPENIRGWLQGYSDEIQYAVDNRMSADAETAQLWKDLIEGNSKAAKTRTEVAPLIQTKWDQIQYYNLYCPAVADGPSGRAYTGCVATAMAQIMKYWEYPSHGMGSHSYTWSAQTLSANFGETTYDWSNMKNYYQSYYDDEGNLQNAGTPSSTEIAAVSTLMYHCGVSLEMSYGGYSTGGSSASTAAVVDALKTYFNYSLSMDYKTKSSYTDDAWIALVKAELNSNRPLQYRGSSGAGGHSFICDGYDNSDNFHFNWGWAGWCNGFYDLSDLTTTDPGSGGGNGNYTNDQGAIFGIQPSGCTAEAPTGLTYIQNGRNVTLNWNAASGAASYNIYLDNNLVGNAATNSYATTAPYGTHYYYVRSVDGSGELSLSSNSVNVTVDYQTPVVNDLQASLSGSNANLSWTAPDWCYPETPSATLTYGTQINSGTYFPWTEGLLMYWGHRYLTSDLSLYDGMRLYSVEIYINEPGDYQICLYNGTTIGSYTCPETAIGNSPTVTFSSKGWHSIELTTPIVIDATKDLWIFVHNPTAITGLKSYLCTDSGGTAYGVYYSDAPQSYTHNNASGYAFLLKAYLTDGTYTYHLYDNGVSVEDDIAATSYTVTSPANNTAHQYTVKTNYYAGETAASNMAGLTLGTASVASLSLGANDKMTVAEDAKLTVTGTLSNSGTADNLVIENGGQLVTSDAVASTVKKDITGYNGGTGKWYMIASPVNNNLAAGSVANLVDGTYDLYQLDQSKTSEEWCNYKANTFTIDNQKGYLYANNADVTLSFAGSLKPSNANVAVDLAYTSGNRIAGYNLVGNPFPCNAYANKAYYAMNAAGTNFEAKTTSDAIAPCTGVVVCATGTGQSVTFSKTAPDASINNGSLQIALTQANEKDGVSSSTTTDNAIVSFNEGEELGKFVFNENNAKIYFTQDGKDLAIATRGGKSGMPLNFTASQDGVYILSVEPKDVEMNYLHLVDKLTGNDIDLLATPNYTFEAKTSDNENRFRLVFGGSSTGSETAEPFAFFDGSTWVIENIGQATLQVVDVMGRVLSSEVLSGNATTNTTNLSSGVYVLRLVNGEQVKTQKIIIE